MHHHQPLSMTIAHLNDTHSYFEPSSLQLELTVRHEKISPYVSAGGFARIATRVNQLKGEARSDERHFLLLHAGDCFQGTLYFSLFRGEANATLLNELGVDAMVLGNHELDLGNEAVAHFARNIDFPLLAGNWDLSQELQEKPHRLSEQNNVYRYDVRQQTAQWLVREYGQESVAIFGLTLDRMDDISNPDADTPFVAALDVAHRTVKAIQDSGINKIILLSHLGYEVDLQLAESVTGISLIVGGHSHVLQGDLADIGLSCEDPYGIRVKETYIVQAGCHALALGHCHIDFDVSGKVVRFQGRNELLIGRRLFVDAARQSPGSDWRHQHACDYLEQHPLICVCGKDSRIQDILNSHYLPVVRQQQTKEVVTLTQPLFHTRIPGENGGSEIAPLVARAFFYAMHKREHPVQFAVHNAGAVRCSLPTGILTVADIAGNLLPFAIPIGVYYVTGATLKSFLEGAIDNALGYRAESTGTGSYPYCYGLDFHYQAEMPAGERIQELKVHQDGNWISVCDSSVYCGTSSAYTMKGKEGYEAILEMVQPGMVSNVSMADALIEMLQDKPDWIHLSDGAVPTAQAHDLA
ncbi:bifunctional metallophosphatase/5'-nucleotidase [Vibrio mangrovi]|uniref:Bifunctional metallophosphatase/5'-nucleotidase n=1 Tax=Vibrio mangrovi TaxID=474394 RepID=A0A1Y6ISV7_9VIBR|nr:bifunctional metallophosphatase/5'-nucleotidase [Vibrio mangrovi]MDW6005553.1 bifunctional metallophosphatase/5'-nucleotidase [Vibrio mangrovi]SMS00724.1 NAD 5'-nucleotidase precursor [Vibrio mangrovi]